MDDYEILDDTCDVHGCNLHDRECDDCSGEGGYHDCGEDCCCCINPEETTHRCRNCKGTGFIRWCPENSEQNPCNKENWKSEIEESDLA